MRGYDDRSAPFSRRVSITVEMNDVGADAAFDFREADAGAVEIAALGVHPFQREVRHDRIEAGDLVRVAKLVGTDEDLIVAEGARLLHDDIARQHMVGAGNPYGDGRAGARIVDIVEATLDDTLLR